MEKLNRSQKTILALLSVYTIIILFFYNPFQNLYCAELKEKIMKEIETGYACTSDSDCELYPSLSDSCLFPGACAISLKTGTDTQYISSMIKNYLSRGCGEASCTVRCASMESLRPVCADNYCTAEMI